MPGKFSFQSPTFVCEADEFAVSPGINNAPRFSFLNPKVVVVTNIEHDHPDIYPTIEDTKKTFLEFFNKIPQDGILIACIDNPNVKELVSKISTPVTTYGFDTSSDLTIVDLGLQEGLSTFKLKTKEGLEYTLKLKVYGDYNLRNATAAFIVGQYLGLSTEDCIKGVESFEGSQRRFEKVGETKNEVVIFDDYAHHPKEIISVLGAARKLYPEKRLVAIFQPHTYSRTKGLFSEFALAFGTADLVGIMDIYSSAREIKDPEVSSENLAKEIGKYHPNSFYSGNHEETLTWLKENLKKGDLLVTMGAGDIFYLLPKILEF